MRVAHVIQSVAASAGGTTTAFLNLLAAAAQRPALSLTAYAQRPPESDPFWNAVKPVEHGGMAGLERIDWRLVDSLGRFRAGELGRRAAAELGAFDALHLHGLWSPDLSHLGLAARRAGTPYIWQSHGMLLGWAMNYKRLKKQVYLRLGLGRALAGAAAHVAMTVDELESSIFPPPPPGVPVDVHRVVVPLPVAMPGLGGVSRAALRAEARAAHAIPEQAFTFAFLGRLHPVKRVELTIEAFARAFTPPSATRDARLLLLGHGDDDYVATLRALGDRLGVTGRVVFAGWTSGRAKTAGLCAADALTLNSSIESFGYVLFEALDAGTPVLMTENLSLARDFAAARAATIAPPTVLGLSAAMRALSDRDAGELAAHAAGARAWAAETYSPAAVGRRLEALYEGVIARRPRRDGRSATVAHPPSPAR